MDDCDDDDDNDNDDDDDDGQEVEKENITAANHVVTICVCVMFFALYLFRRFQNFRPLSEEQRLRVGLEVYNAALALDGGTKRFLHALQDLMRKRSTMAPLFLDGRLLFRGS